MSKTLVICEKPSVATDVARALGVPKKDASFFESDEYVVGFAVGHLVEQVDPEAYDAKYKTWRFEDLPIVPESFRYEARDARAQKQLSLLHRAVRRKDVGTVVNACDAGREGELIFKLILQTANVDKPVKRAWFSSMTQTAIRDAFAHLRDDAELRPLEDAARSRSEADWLVGMNASRAATTRMGSRRAPLSLGRVQTPTLAIIVNRDLEIARFVPEDYWQVRATFETRAGAGYAGLWVSGSRDRLSVADEAERIAAAARSADGRVASVERKPVVERAPLLYDLTSLQREANNRFGFTAGRTLGAAQACYDQHKVLTYPRTSSRFLSSDLKDTLKSTARRVGAAAPEYAAGADYVAGLDVLPLGRVVSDAKVTDHHAIIPTEDRHTLSRLSSDERRIYDLVARRFLAVFHPDARSEATTVLTEAGGERFRSRGKVLVVAGWRAVYGATTEVEQAEGDDDAEQPLPALDEGEDVTCREADVLAKQTKPPAHYSDATLLRAMETAGRLVEDDEAAEAMKESGLGTPATRAATIERLIDKEYVDRVGKSLHATDRGIGLVSALGDQELTRPALTGEWEKQLLEIERGKGDRAAFMRATEEFTRRTVEWFATKDRSAMRIHRRVIGPCPRCDGEIVERPKSYSCTSWRSKDEPGCGFQIWKQISGHDITPEMAAAYVEQGISGDEIRFEREEIGECPQPGCGGKIVENLRAFGCTSWQSREEPGCGFVIWKKVRGQREVTADAAREMLRTGATNAAPAASKEPLGACPTAGCEGQIVENSRAFGCTSWKSRKEPGCGFVIWKRQRGGAAVDRAQAIEMLRSGSFDTAQAPRAPKEPIGACPTPGCEGQIVENSRAFGCTSWKSKKNPGCGFVIWKRPRGLRREIDREEAAGLLAQGLSEPPRDESDAA